MGEYRRITRACAKRDWRASTHDEVLAQHDGSHLLQRFLTDKSLDHCYAGSNVLDRARDRLRGAPSPGPGIIGNFHIKAPVTVDVVEELAERWIIVDRLATNRKPVAYETAYALADAAFDGIDDEDVAEVLQKTTILDGAHVIDPGRVYAWSAVV